MEQFYESVAQILEVERVKGSDVLESRSERDSLSMLSVITMGGSNHGVNLTARITRFLGPVSLAWAGQFVLP